MTDDIKERFHSVTRGKLGSGPLKSEEKKKFLHPLASHTEPISDRQVANSVMDEQALVVPKNSWFLI